MRVSPEEGEGRGKVRDPTEPTGLVPALLCGPGTQEPVPPTGRAMAWLRIRQHQCCAYPMYLGDTSMTLYTHTGD